MLSPAASHEREAGRPERPEVLDALRGFALSGVVVANTVAALGFNPYFNPSLVADDRDRIAFRALTMFIDGRFLAMYSLLFGIGFGIMASRAASNDGGFVHLYLRRAAALFLIGVANLVFFGGDVLHIYALLAVVLLTLRNVSTRTLVVIAILSLFLPVLGRTLVDALGVQRSSGPDPALVQRLRVEGPYLALVELRLAELPRRWWGVLNSTYLLGLFIAGFIIARHRIVQDSAKHRRLLVVVLAVGMFLTLVGVVAEPGVQAWAGSVARPWRYVANTVGSVTTIAQMLAYVAAFLLLWRSANTRRVLVRLAPSGRLALTNYILVYAIVLVGVSVTGAYGTVGPAAGCAIGISIWVALLFASDWWIARFRLGPVEWVWRSLAYGKRQVIRYLKTASGLDPVRGTL